MAAPEAVITGWGSYAPPRVLSNHDLESIIDTTDAWILDRTGIRERHVVDDGEATSSMAAMAARVAIERAGIAADELDAVMVATAYRGPSRPDRGLPGPGAVLCEMLVKMNLSQMNLTNDGWRDSERGAHQLGAERVETCRNGAPPA